MNECRVINILYWTNRNFDLMKGQGIAQVIKGYPLGTKNVCTKLLLLKYFSLDQIKTICHLNMYRKYIPDMYCISYLLSYAGPDPTLEPE